MVTTNRIAEDVGMTLADLCTELKRDRNPEAKHLEELSSGAA